MPNCAVCPNQIACHSDSTGNLQMIREIDEAFRLRNMAKLETFIDKFWKRLRLQHQQKSGR